MTKNRFEYWEIQTLFEVLNRVFVEISEFIENVIRHVMFNLTKRTYNLMKWDVWLYSWLIFAKKCDAIHEIQYSDVLRKNGTKKMCLENTRVDAVISNRVRWNIRYLYQNGFDLSPAALNALKQYACVSWRVYSTLVNQTRIRAKMIRVRFVMLNMSFYMRIN